MDIFDASTNVWTVRILTFTPISIITLPSSNDLMFLASGSTTPQILNPTTNSFVGSPAATPFTCSGGYYTDNHVYSMPLQHASAVGFICSASLTTFQLLYTSDNGLSWAVTPLTFSTGVRPVVVDNMLVIGSSPFGLNQGTVFTFQYDPSASSSSTTGPCCGASMLQPAPLMLLVFFVIYSIIWLLWV